MTFRIKLFIALITLILINSCIVYAQAPLIRFQVEGNYPPFQFYNHGYLTGFDIDFSNLIFMSKDFSLEYSSDNFEKVYGRLKKGEIDTCGLISVTEERKKEILYTDTVLNTHFALFAKKSTKNVALHNLNDFKIGVVKGFNTESLLKDKLKVGKYITYKNADECIDGLVQGQVEVIFANQEVANFLLIQKGLIGEVSPRISEMFPTDFAFGIRKDYPELVEYMNGRISKLKNSNAYEEIYQKYFFSHSQVYYENIKEKITFAICIIIAIALGFVIYIRFLRNKIFRINLELSKQHEWLRTTLSSIGDAVIATDDKGKITFMNNVAQKLTGYSLAEAIDKPVKEILHTYSESSRQPISIPIENAINETSSEPLTNFSLLVSKDNEEHWISASIAPIKSDMGGIIGAVMVIRDITERKQTERRLLESYVELEATHEELAAVEEKLRRQFDELQKGEEALRVSEERYRIALEASNDGIWDWDIKNNKVFVSERFTNMYGYTQEEIDGTIEQWFIMLHPDDISRSKQDLERLLDRKISNSWYEQRARTKDGDYIWILSKTKAIYDENGNPVRLVGSHTDITERKMNDERIHYLAYYDSLTGLPNRTLFLDRLNMALVQTKRSNEIGALIFFDLDNFKNINDSLGHAFGDLILESVGRMIRGILREGDTLARLGGDEFIILLPKIKDIEDVTSVASRVVKMFQKPWALEGHEFYITTSVGVTIFPKDGEDDLTLLKNADTAMYRAKELGRNNYQLFTPSMNNKVIERLEMESSLRRAIDREEFVLHYQPQIDIDSGKIIGVEALIRWQHPTMGLVSPLKFIPLAEDSGLIVPIGEWVLKTACLQNRKWQEQGLPPLNIAVNLSARQFQQHNLVDTISRVLQETEMKSHLLELEITESLALNDLDFTVLTLNKLKLMGIKVALDDFGTGYSSLNYLKRLPISTLKMDKAFVHDIKENSHEEMIAKAVITLAHNMKLSVTAEGVETREQLDFLKGQKCDKAQGFLFSVPLPSGELEKLLGKNITF